MIPKLKRKVIALAMTAVSALLLVVVVGMNIISFASLVAEADSTLELLSQHRGHFPDVKNEFRGPFDRPLSPELPFESRYFSVILSPEGRVILTDTGKIASVDPGTAAEYGRSVFGSNKKEGFLGAYRYCRRAENGDVRIVFLDCGRKLDAYHTFLGASIAMALCGLLIVFIVIFFCAGRIVAPIARSYEKQKRFITDAGHELKTPLTIISANVDVLEMEQEAPNESLEDIRRQTRRLTKLTGDLVMLARMEEAGESLPMIDFPLSEVVQEAAEPFRKLAQAKNKELGCRIQPMLTLHGNADGIGQLVGVLMDNALKYTPDGGKIRLQLQRSGKTVTLTVENECLNPPSGEDCRHLFDRFYRTDASRNSETGGHGIGLSVAQAIVTAHAGKLHATTEDKTFRITATFQA